VLPTFGRFLLLALLMGMIRGHDHHRRPRSRHVVAGHPAPAPHATTPLRRPRDWQRAGVWQQLHHALLDQLGRQGQLDWSRASLDSLSVRAKRGAA